MRLIILTAALLGCFLYPSALIADSRDVPELEDSNDPDVLKKRAYCVLALGATYNQYEWILDNWIVRKNSPWHIESNFKRLVAENEGRFAKILDLANLGKQPADGITALKERMRALDNHRVSSLITFTDVRVANDEFGLSLFSVETAVADLKKEVDALYAKCSWHKGHYSHMQFQLDEYKKVINTYRTYVHQSSLKTENLFLILSEMTKAELYRAYIKKTNERLEDVRRQIDDALALDAIYGEFQAWWQHSVIKIGIGDDLHRKYLMYYRPLLRMQGQLQKANEYIEKVAGTVKPSASKDRILADLNQAKNLIEEEIRDLEAKGWTGQRDRQIEVSQALQAKDLPGGCKRNIDQHLAAVRAASSVHDLKIASAYYTVMLNSCKSGGVR